MDRYATPAMLRAIAAQAANGRLLLVGTTDLDSGEVIVWNMGAIASQGGRRALRLFRKVLVASASIPGGFLPVRIPVEASHEIFDEMHVDGSTSSAFLFAPRIISVLPGGIAPLRGTNVHLVINGHLRPRVTSTPNRTIAILRRSINTELASDSRARVKLVYSFALRQEMTLRVTEIPTSYRLGGLMGNLESPRMRALFACGKRCASERRVWSDPLTLLDRVTPHRDTSPHEAGRCAVPTSRSAAGAQTPGSASDRRLPSSRDSVPARASHGARAQGGRMR